MTFFIKIRAPSIPKWPCNRCLAIQALPLPAKIKRIICPRGQPRLSGCHPLFDLVDFCVKRVAAPVRLSCGQKAMPGAQPYNGLSYNRFYFLI